MRTTRTMTFDLRNRHGGEGRHADQGRSSEPGPGKRSAVEELYQAQGAAGDAAPGAAGPERGGRPPLFAGPVEWEDIHDEEDPGAAEEALQPDADEDVDLADQEGELDPDSGDDDEEAEGPAPAAPAGEPGREPAMMQAASTPDGPGERHARTASTRDRGGGDGDRDGGGSEGSAARAPLARAAADAKTYRVDRRYREGPYRGHAKYDVRVTAKDVTIIVGVRLNPRRGVTRAQVKQVKRVSQEIFKQKYDAHFKVVEIPYRPRPLRMRVRFAHPSPHHEVALHKGGGRDNAANWYVNSVSIVRAHEIGHLLGLKDEYRDETSPRRKVHTDNSIMGDYYSEGIRTASLKRRHGNTFARDISAASGRRFRISS